MTKEELLSAIAGLTDTERAEIFGGKPEKNTYKVVDVIRLYFGAKPDKDTRAKMSEAGFHWNSFDKYWYADATEKSLAFVEEYKFEEYK